MASAVFFMGLLSLLTPVGMMLKDGVGQDPDDDSLMQWLTSLDLQSLMLLRAFIASGVMLMFTGLGLAFLP